MTYKTEERLKSYLDTNQLHREQLCTAILAMDKRFSNVQPRHPRGGPDGGRDIEAIFNNELLAYGAVGFVNQANDSKEQKDKISRKFLSDLESALKADEKPDVFVFFTNINFTIGERDKIIRDAKKQGITLCEIFDRERLRIALDAPDGFSLRFQYLGLPLSEEEQASFFSRWGDDIQSVISTGFQKVKKTLDRLLFLQEATYPLSYLTISLKLKERYSADDIGHFRLFAHVFLNESKKNIRGLMFGSSDKSCRMSNNMNADFRMEHPGIRSGISAGTWIIRGISEDALANGEPFRYDKLVASSSVGVDEVESLSITYSQYQFTNHRLNILLKDLDKAYLSLAANNRWQKKFNLFRYTQMVYKIQEIGTKDFNLHDGLYEKIPVYFTSQELEDPWKSITASAFEICFFEKTPKRISTPDNF